MKITSFRWLNWATGVDCNWAMLYFGCCVGKVHEDSIVSLWHRGIPRYRLPTSPDFVSSARWSASERRMMYGHIHPKTAAA